MGYHKIKIDKGEIGEVSKIAEEVLELYDSMEQGNKILAINEISDIYGALEAFLKKHFPYLEMDDIKKMANATRKAFEDGDRK